MSDFDSRIILVTGIMASGKSTVAQRLAERFPKSVHLRGDSFRRMIVNGRVEMEPGFDDIAHEQLWLRYSLSVTAVNSYCEAGFTVVYQDIIIGPDLQKVVDLLKQSNPQHSLYLIVLCPSIEVVTQREAARDKVGYTSWTPADLDQSLRTETAHIGLWLDTSDLSIGETVDAILNQLEEARV